MFIKFKILKKIFIKTYFLKLLIITKLNSKIFIKKKYKTKNKYFIF